MDDDVVEFIEGVGTRCSGGCRVFERVRLAGEFGSEFELILGLMFSLSTLRGVRRPFLIGDSKVDVDCAAARLVH